MSHIINHPGPINERRATVLPCRAQRKEIDLEPNISLVDSVARGLQRFGATSAYVWLDDVSVDPLRCVIPTKANDPDHPIWYSETIAPEGPAKVGPAGLFFGIKEGKPFAHCHGTWRLASGEMLVGHLLPLETMVAAPARVSAFVIFGAVLEVEFDPETNCRLFAPEIENAPQPDHTVRALLCTIRPNENLAKDVARICHDRGFAKAEVHGIGSLAGATLKTQKGRLDIETVLTELLIVKGRFDGRNVSFEAALVATDGSTYSGVLDADNVVAVTFELLITET